MRGKLLAFGVSLLAVATIGVIQLPTKAVDNSRDCDQFAIIHCGTLNGDELRSEFETNGASAANGYTTAQSDIRAVFNAMGISRSDLNGTFKQGIVRKNGNVEVDGKVVATDARMAARGLGGTQIAGTNAQKVSVSAMSDAQTALVKLDANGKFLYAVMKPCGNPVTAQPKVVTPPQPEPTAKCSSLKVIKKEEDQNAYLATATAATTGKATIKSYTFNLFHNGTRVINKTIPSNAMSQSLVFAPITSPGTYRAQVIVETSEGTRKGPQCEATFSIAQPPAPQNPAVDITKFVDNDKKYLRVNANVEYTYKIDVRNTGNVDLDDVVVTDTPDRGITLLSVTPPSGRIQNNTLVFTIPKLLKGETRTFAVTAKVPVALAGKLVNTVCVDAPAVPGSPDKCDKAEVEVPPTPVPGKIEVCVLAEKTIRQVAQEEADANPSLYSKNLSDCDEVPTVTELPQTGPIETVMSVVGAMSLVGSAAYYVASRRTL
ncbi:MAG: hypothetical protein WBK76_04975 [Candidatus Saccharimonadales bacterium]